MNRHVIFPIATLLMLVSSSPSVAQVISGTISGAIIDPSNAAVVGASITLVNEGTTATRTAQSDQTGRFSFAAMQPGSYTIRISAPGFRTLERTGNVLVANSTLEMEPFALVVGETKESVSVSAQAIIVQTGSSESSALLSSSQIETLGTRGRDVTSLLTLLPGVSVGSVNEVPNGPGYGNAPPNIMGHPANWSAAAVDGLAGNDLGSAVYFSSPNMDSVGEVQVQLNGYQAQYGGNSGA